MQRSLLLPAFLFFLFQANVHAQYQKFILLDTKADHSSPIEAIEMAPDGVTMLVGHHDGYVVAWDLNTMTMKKEVQGHSGQINTILFDKTGNQFITAAEDGKVVIWDWPSMKINHTYSVPQDVNTFGILTPDGSSIYFGGYDNNRAYDSRSGRYTEPYAALYRIQLKGSGRAEIAFNEENGSYGSGTITDGNLDYEGKYVVFTKGPNLCFYDIATRKITKVSCPYSLNNFTSTKDAFYVWGDKMLMKLVKEGGQWVVKNTVLAGTRNVYSGYSKMVLSSNGKLLVTGDDYYTVNIWDPSNMTKLQSLSGHYDLVRTFTFWKNDSILITGGYDGQLKIWGYKEPEHDSDEVADKEVVFAENNIPVSIKDRSVELQTTVKVKDTEFEIQIWDKSVVDGDSISLNLNGEWILKDYAVVRTKHIIKVKLDPRQTNNYLIMYAHNLGDISPNTAAVSIKVNGKEYKLSLTSDMEKSAAINFEYDPH